MSKPLTREWSWLIAGGVVLVLAILMGLFQLPNIGGIEYDLGDTNLYCVHSDQCELPGSKKLIAETQNTLSNLAYLFFGICALIRGFQPGSRMVVRPAMLMFGFSLCFLALCSGYYHATLNFDGTRDADGALRAAHLLDPEGSLFPDCTGSPRHDDKPQILDIIGVYLALFSLFLFGVDKLAGQPLPDSTARRAGAAVAIGGGLCLIVVGFPLVAGRNAAGGGFAGAYLAAVLVALSLFVVLAHHSGKKGLPALMWISWTVVLIVTTLLSYAIKSKFSWDSTGVFAIMMGGLAAVLAANWIVSGNPVPLPEFLILGIVFILGIAPRMLDGYDLVTGTEVTTLLRKDFCSPKGVLQAHAMWHVLSAIALALTFDLLEKTRPAYDGPPGTLVLGQYNDFADGLWAPIWEQSVAQILVKIVLSLASVLMFIVTLANHKHSLLGVAVLGPAAVLLSVSLWLLPVFGRRSS